MSRETPEPRVLLPPLVEQDECVDPRTTEQVAGADCADHDSRRRAELGWAVHSRADDVAAAVIARVTSAAAAAGLAPDRGVFETFARADRLATQFLGRWLATGEIPTKSETEALASLGTLADRVSLTLLLKGYLVWRDATIDVLEQEARRLGSDESVVREARVATRRSADSSMVHMAKQFDLERQRLTDKLAEERRKLTHLALHDALTGLPNRALLSDRMAHALSAAGKAAGTVGVIFLDLDGFKAVNDSLGHEAGDRLLVAVAARLRQMMRPSDTVARLGGDEFVIFCQGLANGEEDAVAVASRALDTVRQPCSVDQQDVFVSASLGIALATPGDDPETLLANADAAMYLAKDRGATWEVYREQMGEVTMRRAVLRQELRRAVERHELKLHYQPISTVGDTNVVSMEALCRWEHPEWGQISPMEFIALAEESGLIRDLDNWVLVEACRQGASWHSEGWNVGVAVNISVRHLDGPSLEAAVRAALTESGLPPGALTLEITESRLMNDPDAVIEALSALGDLGVRLAIDDFGVGYSSLSYLQRLPVDQVKVDRSFISGLGTSNQDSAVVEAIVGLAHNLGLSVVAEGVETEGELAEVRRLGCDEVQGYLMARPCAPEDIAAPGLPGGQSADAA